MFDSLSRYYLRICFFSINRIGRRDRTIISTPLILLNERDNKKYKKIRKKENIIVFYQVETFFRNKSDMTIIVCFHIARSNKQMLDNFFKLLLSLRRRN